MAERIFTGAFLFINGRNFTCNFASVDFNISSEMVDRTALCDSARNRRPGLVDWNADYRGFWANQSSAQATSTGSGFNFDAVHFSGVGSSNAFVVLGPGPLASSADCYFARGVQESYVVGGQVGELLSATVNIQGSDFPIKGRVNYYNELAAVSTAGPGASLGALSATQTLYATVHAFKHLTTTNTVTVEIESSTDVADFTINTTRITFTGITSTGAQLLSVAGPITDTAFRFVVTTTGPTSGFGLLTAFGVR